MMKIIHKYLVKQFLQTILFGLLAFTVLFVIIDMMENLDDFIDQNVPNNFIVQYYFVFIPEIARLILPVSVLLASLFTVGKMSNQNELTAIKASGVSLYRFMMPFLVTAFLISIFSIYFGGYVVPFANKQKVYIEQNYMKKGIVQAGNDIYFQDSQTLIVTISRYDVLNDQAFKISMQEFSKDDLTKMVSRIDAVRMNYDSTKTAWILYNGTERKFTDSSETINRFLTKEIQGLNFTPEEVIKKQRKPEEMTLGELKEYAEDQRKTGNDPTRVLIEYHSKIAFAFASFVVVLFGLPLSANKRRGGLAIQLGMNLFITFIYLVFMKVSQAFGKNGVLNPLLTAWAANLVFLIAAAFNIKNAEK